MDLPYPIVIETAKEEDEQYYKDSIKELPGLAVYGDTINEVFEEIDGAKEAWLSLNIELGRPINLPEQNIESFSGKLTLRIPKSLPDTLATEAQKEGVSLNLYLNNIIERGRGS